MWKIWGGPCCAIVSWPACDSWLQFFCLGEILNWLISREGAFLRYFQSQWKSYLMEDMNKFILHCRINTIAAGDLAVQGARASGAMVLMVIDLFLLDYSSLSTRTVQFWSFWHLICTQVHFACRWPLCGNMSQWGHSLQCSVLAKWEGISISRVNLLSVDTVCKEVISGWA